MKKATERLFRRRPDPARALWIFLKVPPVPNRLHGLPGVPCTPCCRMERRSRPHASDCTMYR